MTDNPYRRLRELTRTTQKDFAVKYGFSKTAIANVESGMYPDLSEDMLAALGAECEERHVDAVEVLAAEYMTDSVQDAYHAWLSTERLKVAHRFQSVPFSGRATPALSPFSFVMADIAKSRRAFCQLLKVPQASVMRYETGLTRSMPKVLEEAFKEVHYPHLDDLKAAQEAWQK